jgi:hypothetical protein
MKGLHGLVLGTAVAITVMVALPVAPTIAEDVRPGGCPEGRVCPPDDDSKKKHNKPSVDRKASDDGYSFKAKKSQKKKKARVDPKE